MQKGFKRKKKKKNAKKKEKKNGTGVHNFEYKQCCHDRCLLLDNFWTKASMSFHARHVNLALARGRNFRQTDGRCTDVVGCYCPE
ncbi:hypothetical protein V1478_010211 [Vespula squamosa]|uniref:Uncharacterized protein n=1 Tax=Vespula squamosa TaxID=30214 RepID=A0ABD2ALS6_VESSQ